MKIVMVSSHSCVRVHKIALPLIMKGHEVHLIARKRVPLATFYKTFTQYDDLQGCADALKLHKDADIIHCHNEPSIFVMLAKEVTDTPVILDAHDSFLTRSTPEEHLQALEEGRPHTRVTAEERTAFQLADGVNFVSESMKDIVSSEFNLDCPMTVLPSYVPKVWYKYHFQEWMGGLVYEGRVTTPKQQRQHAGTGSHYCDYQDLANKCKDIGMDFHLYAGRNDEEFMSIYDPICLVHKGYPYMDLLNEISAHDWGVVGNSVHTPQWQVALPNKMFDYLAAGVPSVVINATAAAELVQEHKFGIVVDSVQELAERWKEHRDCRKHLFKARQDLSMENHIHIVEDLYAGVS